MCRIAGIVYGPNREFLNTAELASILYPQLVKQGPHAWGWASYNESTETITWEKQAGRCDTKQSNLAQLDRIDPDAKWIILHTRFATHGSPKDNRNNHPIRHDNIIGVHNGVLRNHADVLKITGREDEKTEVDSEAIFAAVNKWGASAGMRKIDGDAVAVYADVRKPHLVHIARSHGRSLHLGWTDKGNLIFASDYFALKALESWGVTFVKFSQVGENKILILRNGQIIQRHRFAAPAPKKVVSKWTGSSFTSRSYYDDAYWEHINDMRDNGVTVDRVKEFNDFVARNGVKNTNGTVQIPKEKQRSGKKTNKKQRRQQHLELALPQSYYDELEALDEFNREPDIYGITEAADLYEWNGVYLTRAEYEEAVQYPELYNGK